LQVFLTLPGNGAPHAIFLPRQKRHASRGFSGIFPEGEELRPFEGEYERNSVEGGVDGQEMMGESQRDVSDGLGSDWSLCSGELNTRSDNSRRMTPIWQLYSGF
jgi:hypothetical protein